MLTFKSEYKAWKNARQRCNNPNRTDYKYYGGKGIKFLYTSFEQFLSDVGTKPDSSYMLDRIDGNKHYEIGNVRWVTKQMSNLNRTFANPYPTNKTHVLGVYLMKNGKYQARAKGGKSLYYGDSLEMAIAARKLWEISINEEDTTFA